MKKIILLFICLQASIIFSQTIPNSGFETWVTNTETPHNYLVPQNWISIDVIENSFNSNYTGSSVVRTTQSHSGQYAVLLQTAISGGDTSNGGLFSCNSLANLFGPSGFYGFPFTTRPASFTGYYKFTSVGGDIAAAIIMLTKWNTVNHKRDTILQNFFFTNSNTSSYIQFNIPLTYTLNEYPDTVTIQAEIGSAGVTPTTHVGTQFYLDDLGFSGSVPFGIEQYSENNNFIIYPNPANNNIAIQSKSGKELGDIFIYNSLGETVFQERNKNNFQQIDISKLPIGIYIINAQGVQTKFIKE